MTITPAFVPLSGQIVFDLNAEPIPGAQLFAFDAETTNPRTLFANAAMTTPLPTPVLANAYGRLPPMWAGVGAYKLVLQDAAGAQLEVIDDIPGGTDSGTAPPAGTTIPTGHIMPAHRSTASDGWLLLNGKSIGGPTSGASARASTDVQALYTLLWNEDTSLAVNGGRGANATSDFVAGKTLALPDYRGRTFFGLDGMGSTLAGRITGFTTSLMNTVGAMFGWEAASLSVDQMPNHNHNIYTGNAGAHGHGGGISPVNDHQHGGSTSTVGDHTHSYQAALGSPGGTSIAVPNNSGAYQYATNPAGAHNHSFTTDPAGGHNHGLTINPVGDHAHPASSDPVGGGNNHANMPPAVLGSWLIKL